MLAALPILLVERTIKMKTIKGRMTLVAAVLLSCLMLFNSCMGFDAGFALGQDDGESQSQSTQNTAQEALDQWLNDIEKGDSSQPATPDLDKPAVNDAQSAAARSLMSVVSIRCGGSGNSTFSQYISAGSGVIYKLDKNNGNAIIITNQHVVYSGSSKNNGVYENIDIFLYGAEHDSMAIDASYIGGSVYYDIAILFVSGSDAIKNSDVMAAELANSNDIYPGQTAIAVGNPANYGISVTKGIISTASEYIAMSSIDGGSTITLRVIRVDAAVNSGNSGGGLFNGAGQLIGIVNAKSADLTIENIGYAIPVNVARAIADNILHYCADGSHITVMRTMLGITVEVIDSRTVYDSENGTVEIDETIGVQSVTEGSLAHAVLKAGDIINSVKIGTADEIAVTRQYHVIDAMLDARVGDTVVFNVTRDNKELNLTIKITSECLIEY